MLLTTSMDDTNLTSIRRSIFIYASFIAFVSYYGLSINGPSILFDSVNLAKDKTINGSTLIILAILVQIYLLSRLTFTKPIALAKLQKTWGFDELQRNDNFSKLVDDLQEMVRKSDDVQYPTSQIDPNFDSTLRTLSSEMNKVAQSHHDLSQKLLERQYAHDGLVKSAESANVKFQHLLNTLSEQSKETVKQAAELRAQHSSSDHSLGQGIVSGNERSAIVPEMLEVIKTLKEDFSTPLLSEIRSKIDPIQSLLLKAEQDAQALNEKLGQFKMHAEYCQDFPISFKGNDLKLAIQSVSGEMVRMRQKRETEFDIFEYKIPLYVGTISVVFGLVGFLF